MLKYISVLSLTFGLLSLTGCSTKSLSLRDMVCGQPETVYKTKYIKSKCPAKVNVGKTPTFTITDRSSFDDKYWLINKEQFQKNQNVCHELRVKYTILGGK